MSRMGSGGGVVTARMRFDVADVYVFELELWCVVDEGGFGGLEELLVVALGEVGLVVGSAGLVAEACALDDDATELKHIVELAGKGEAGVGPLALVREVDVAVAGEEFDDLGVGLVEAVVVADDGGVLGHGFAELAPELEGVLGAGVVEQEGVELLLALELGGVATVAFLRGEALRVLHGLRAGYEASIDAGEQGVGSEAVGAMNRIIRFSGSKDSGDVGLLVEVDPETAHGVVHAGEDLHGDFAGVVADELLVDLEDAFELAVGRGRKVGDVEVDHGLAVDAHV